MLIVIALYEARQENCGRDVRLPRCCKLPGVNVLILVLVASGFARFRSRTRVGSSQVAWGSRAGHGIYGVLEFAGVSACLAGPLHSALRDRSVVFVVVPFMEISCTEA